jgi:hypothetical protein
MAVPGVSQDLLVNAWYTGGVDVIDFASGEPEGSLYKFGGTFGSDNWSAYRTPGPVFNGGHSRLCADGSRTSCEGHGGVPRSCRSRATPGWWIT